MFFESLSIAREVFLERKQFFFKTSNRYSIRKSRWFRHRLNCAELVTQNFQLLGFDVDVSDLQKYSKSLVGFMSMVKPSDIVLTAGSRSLHPNYKAILRDCKKVIVLNGSDEAIFSKICL